VFGGIHLQGDGEITGHTLRCVGQSQSPFLPSAVQRLERKGVLTHAARSTAGSRSAQGRGSAEGME
jgi:hypothetical protein